MLITLSMKHNLNVIMMKKDGMSNYPTVMVDLMCTDHTILKRKHLMFFETTYDLFDDKAADQADKCAKEIEKRAAELEVTVDYFIEEFDIDEYTI